MNITLNYKLTRQDWDEALRSNRAWVVHNWAVKILFMIVVSLAAVVILIHQQSEKSLPPFFFSAALMLLVVVFIWLLASVGRRNFPQAVVNYDLMSLGSCTVSLSDSGLTITQQYRQSTWQWPAFIRFDATPNLLLLYLSRHAFLAIPKQSFSAADLDTLVHFLMQIFPAAGPPEAALVAMQRTLRPAERRAPQIQPLESRDFM